MSATMTTDAARRRAFKLAPIPPLPAPKAGRVHYAETFEGVVSDDVVLAAKLAAARVVADLGLPGLTIRWYAPLKAHHWESHWDATRLREAIPTATVREVFLDAEPSNGFVKGRLYADEIWLSAGLSADVVPRTVAHEARHCHQHRDPEWREYLKAADFEVSSAYQEQDATAYAEHFIRTIA